MAESDDVGSHEEGEDMMDVNLAKGIVRWIAAVVSFGFVAGATACDGDSGGGKGTTSASEGTTSSSASDASSSSSTATCSSSVISDGYLTVNGPDGTPAWQGYAFTATDHTDSATADATCTAPLTTASPDCSTSCTPTGEFSGTVAACEDYGGFAMLGWDVAQPKEAGATVGTWKVPSSGGVTFEFTGGQAGAPIRIQLQEANAKSNDQRYCAEITSGKEVKWADIKSYCWGSGGTAVSASGKEIAQAAIEVYGTKGSATPYHLCLTNISMQAQ